MSYDINFKAKIEGTQEYVNLGGSANITWNVKELIKQSSGWDIKNCDYNGLVKDLILNIEFGIYELTRYPDKYRQYESSNGWGTIDGVKGFYKQILEDWKELKERYPQASQVAVVYVD